MGNVNITSHLRLCQTVYVRVLNLYIYASNERETLFYALYLVYMFV